MPAIPSAPPQPASAVPVRSTSREASDIFTTVTDKKVLVKWLRRLNPLKHTNLTHAEPDLDLARLLLQELLPGY